MENYEQKYKAALGWMRGLYNGLHGKTKEEAERFFPELKESEDERIRTAILNHLKKMWGNCKDDICGVHVEDAIAWLEKQETSYTKKDIDDAYLKGITDTKNEIKKQHEANYQIRKDIATFIFNYKGEIKDRAKWMNYLGVKISFVEKQDNKKPQGKLALEAVNEEKVNNKNCATDKVEPKFKVGDWVVISTTKGDRVVQIASVEYFTKDGHSSYITTEGRWFGNGTEARLLTDKDVEIATIPESKAIVNKIESWSEDDEKYQQGWHDAIEKQVPVDKDKVVKGVRRGVATSLINYIDANSKGMCLSNMECEDIEDAIVNNKWYRVYNYMKKKLEKQGEKPQGKTALEAVKEEKIDNSNKVEPNSAWSEEDEKNLKRAIWYVENPTLNVIKDTMLSEWLKSLKERIGE